MKIFKPKITLILLTSLLLNFNTQGQQFKTNSEIGALLGGAYYLGDLNDIHFNQSAPALGLIIRQNLDRRVVIKAEAMVLNIKSDERESEDTFAYDRGLHFKSPVYELSGQIEFNFLPYQPGNPLYTWTPFVYTGLSLFNFNPKAENQNGEWVNLQELGTEGQGTTTSFNGETRAKYTIIQFSIPIGGGVKVALSESVNIILEYGARKTFTDYLDDVSTTFVGSNPGNSGNNYPNEMSNEAQLMSDPNGTHLKGDQRGDDTKKDWYSFLGITISFKLDKPNDCPPY